MWMILSIFIVMSLMIVFSLTSTASQAEAISEKQREELQSKK